MDWEQIESKWQAMARRVRADVKDSSAPTIAETKSRAPQETAPKPQAEVAA